MKSASYATITWRCVVVFSGLACLNGVAQSGPVVTEDLGTNSTRLFRALSSKDWLLRRRALQELSIAIPSSRADFTHVLSLVGSMSDNEAYDLVDYLASFAGKDTPEYMDALRNSDGRLEVVLCCALGKNQKVYGDLVPVIEKKVTPERSNDAYAAHVALAQLDVERMRNVDILNQGLANQRDQTMILQSMLLAKMGGWAAESLAAPLRSILQGEGDGAVLAATLLASWKERGEFAANLVRRRESEAKTDGNQVAAYVAYAFCKARLSSFDTNWLTTEVVGLLGSKSVGFDHVIGSVCMLIGKRLLQDTDILKLEGFLESDQRDVVIGATRLCWGVGLPARQTEKQLLRLVETSPDSSVRGASAMALGQVGTEQMIPPLEKALAREEDEAIRATIKAALMTIRLDGASD